MSETNSNSLMAATQRLVQAQEAVMFARKALDKVNETCNHRIANGHLNLVHNADNTYTCKQCEATFKMDVLKRTAIEHAVSVIHDLKHQLITIDSDNVNGLSIHQMNEAFSMIQTMVNRYTEIGATKIEVVDPADEE